MFYKKQLATNSYFNYPSRNKIGTTFLSFLKNYLYFSVLPMVQAQQKGFFVEGPANTTHNNSPYVYGYQDPITDQVGMQILNNSGAVILERNVDLDKISLTNMTTICSHQTVDDNSDMGLPSVVVRLARNVTTIADASFEKSMCEQIEALGGGDLSSEAKYIILGIIGGGLLAVGLAGTLYYYRDGIKNKCNTLFFQKNNANSIPSEKSPLLINESPTFKV